MRRLKMMSILGEIYADGDVMKKLVLGAGLAALVSVNVFAGETYGFLEMGQSKLEFDVGDGYSISKTDNVIGLGAGYNLNPHWAIEAAYRDFGGISETDADDSKSSINMTALQISVVGIAPMSDVFSLYGRLGFGRLKAEYDYVDCCDSDYDESGSDTKNKAVFGVGGEYRFTDALGGRFEFSKFAEIEDVTLSSMSLALTLRF